MGVRFVTSFMYYYYYFHFKLCISDCNILFLYRDVYVVEMDPGKRSQANPVPVIVLLQGEGPKPIPRNVTLVLKSRHRIKWQFGSQGVEGKVVLVVSWYFKSFKIF